MTMQLEIYETTLTKNICTVAYCLQDEQGTADVPVYQISTDKLIDYIEKNELNVYCVNPSSGIYDTSDAYIYLTNNTFEVVESFLMEGLK